LVVALETSAEVAGGIPMKVLAALFIGWGIGLMTAPKQGDWGDLLFAIPFGIGLYFIAADIYLENRGDSNE